LIGVGARDLSTDFTDSKQTSNVQRSTSNVQLQPFRFANPASGVLDTRYRAVREAGGHRN